MSKSLSCRTTPAMSNTTVNTVTVIINVTSVWRRIYFCKIIMRAATDTNFAAKSPCQIVSGISRWLLMVAEP